MGQIHIRLFLCSGNEVSEFLEWEDSVPIPPPHELVGAGAGGSPAYRLACGGWLEFDPECVEAIVVEPSTFCIRVARENSKEARQNTKEAREKE